MSDTPCLPHARYSVLTTCQVLRAYHMPGTSCLPHARYSVLIPCQVPRVHPKPGTPCLFSCQVLRAYFHARHSVLIFMSGTPFSPEWDSVLALNRTPCSPPHSVLTTPQENRPSLRRAIFLSNAGCLSIPPRYSNPLPRTLTPSQVL